VRRTTSTIKRVQDLLTTRRARRLERLAQEQSSEGRDARLRAEGARDDALMEARRAMGPGGGGFGGSR
jgi:hypothetical protein